MPDHSIKVLSVIDRLMGSGSPLRIFSAVNSQYNLFPTYALTYIYRDLKQLSKDGLVHGEIAKGWEGRGRPPVLYLITDAGRAKLQEAEDH